MDAFERLDGWKRSSRLCVDFYDAPKFCRDAGFRDQITRAALSVPSNIAEGYERNSRNEFVRFLKIAEGSCGELRTQLYIDREIDHLEASVELALIRESSEVARMIGGFLSRLR